MKTVWIWAVCGLIVGSVLSNAWGEYQSHGKRDPFVRLIAPDGRRIHPPDTEEWTEQGGGFILQGIVYEEGRRSIAVINQRVFREGDEFQGMKVLKIEPKSVTIQSQGEPQRLTMPSSKKENTEP